MPHKSLCDNRCADNLVHDTTICGRATDGLARAVVAASKYDFWIVQPPAIWIQSSCVESFMQGRKRRAECKAFSSTSAPAGIAPQLKQYLRTFLCQHPPSFKPLVSRLMPFAYSALFNLFPLYCLFLPFISESSPSSHHVAK